MTRPARNKVLLIDTSFAAAPVYHYLVKEGFEVWVMGNRPQDALALEAKSNWINQNYSKVSEVQEHIARLSIDYVVPGCTDVSIETCVQLDLHYKCFDSAEVNAILGNKESFRQLCESLRVPSPKVVEYGKFPIPGKYICKPVDSYSGTGVTVFDGMNIEAGSNAYQLATSASRTSTAIIETYITGQLYSFSAFLESQSVNLFFLVKEAGSANPFAVDTSHVDTDFDVDVANKIKIHVEAIAKYLKLKDGLFHLQFIYSEGVPYFIEVARRCPGDLYPLLIEFSTNQKFAAKYASYFVNRTVESSAAFQRKILRHTVTSDEKIHFNGLRFNKPLNTRAYYPLVMLGQTIEPKQKTRVGLLFAECVSEQHLKETFESFLARSVYELGPIN